MKRLFDILVSAMALLLLWPVLGLLAMLVLVRDGRPILFGQVRPGLAGEPFRIWKFRTMSVPAPAAAEDSGTARITPLGAWLRRTSLDELPELWNVLKGEMSLVGPRPLLMDYLPLYDATQRRRHAVRPGITGWAQVNGRNAIGWDEKFAMDVWYVDHRSMMLDIRILWRTLARVAGGADVDHGEGVTMPRFIGSASPAPKRDA